MLFLKGTDEHALAIARMGSFNDFVPESYLSILNADDCSTFRKYAINDFVLIIALSEKFLDAKYWYENNSVFYWDHIESINVFAFNRIWHILHKYSDT